MKSIDSSQIKIYPPKNQFRWMELTYSASAFSVNGKGYVVVGGNSRSALKELWQYDDVANSWTQKTNFPGEASANMLAFALNSTAYCGLGALGPNETVTNTLWSFNPADYSWKSIAVFTGETRKSYVEGTVGKYGYYGFGSQSKEYSDLWIHAPIDYIP